MMPTERRVLVEIPDYWTPEQALAVYELLDDLLERVLSRYEAQIREAAREGCEPSLPPKGSSDPSDHDF